VPMRTKGVPTYLIITNVHRRIRGKGYTFIRTSSNLVKLNIRHLVKPLTHICNLTFANGVFPQELLTTKVVPILKKNGINRDKNSYRAIALSSVFSKILEKAFAARLIEYLLEKGLISKQQFGSQKGISTSHAIVAALEQAIERLEKKDNVIIACLDLSCAFDCVDHVILLKMGMSLPRVLLNICCTCLKCQL